MTKHTVRARWRERLSSDVGDLGLVDAAQHDDVVADLEHAGVVARDAVLVGQRRRAVEVEHAIGQIAARRC